MVVAGLDPAIPLMKARPRQIIGIAGSSPAMTAGKYNAAARRLTVHGIFHTPLKFHMRP
jgi:hypothetical protein